MQLRKSLLLLSAATAAPLALAFLLATAYVAHREAEVFQQSASLRNRATLAAVDAELRGTINTLLGLAVRVQGDDRGVIDGLLREALTTQPHWQNLVLQWPDGRQIANARLAPGTELPQKLVETRSFEQAVKDARPSIGDLTLAPRLNDEPGIPVRVPVMVAGKPGKVLTAVLRPAALQAILEAQDIPKDWVSGLVGSDGRLIARTPPVPIGTLASPAYRENTARAAEGWYRGSTLEGRDTYTAFSRSSLSGWTIGFAIPAQLVGSVSDGSARLLVLGLALSLAAALLLAYRLSRHIVDPIADLAASAADLGQQRTRREVHTSIDEVAQLAAAFREAGQAIEERDGELLRRDVELTEQAEELRRVDADRKKLLALIAHELRGPLMPLRTALFVLNKPQADPAAQSKARAIMERQITMLVRMVDDLNDAGRIDRGQLQMRPEPLNLHDVVLASAEDMRPQFLAKEQSLVVRPSASLAVVGDQDRLHQVFVNLLSNAHRYTPQGGRILVEMHAAAGNALVTVSDNGVGFSATDKERLFGLFVQLGSKESRPAASLGIGLAMSRAIVDLHGGHVLAESQGVGLGASFTVSLPLAAAAERDGESAMPSTAA